MPVGGPKRMLILSRKVNQRLLIGDSIEITVVELRDGHVRLGITAPPNVTVYREELLRQVVAENLEAATTAQATTSLAECGSEARPPLEKPRVGVVGHSAQTPRTVKGGG
jgi:carbon storage regulator